LKFAAAGFMDATENKPGALKRPRFVLLESREIMKNLV